MFGRRRRPPALCERQQVANSSFEEIWAARPSYRPFLEDQSMLIIERLKFCSFDCAVDDACICGLRVCLCHTSWVTSAVRWLRSVAGLVREVPADCRPLPAGVAEGRLSWFQLSRAAGQSAVEAESGPEMGPLYDTNFCKEVLLLRCCSCAVRV